MKNIGVRGTIGLALLAATVVTAEQTPPSSDPACADPAVIWCDDFESAQDMSSKYYDYDSDEGEFVVVPGVGFGGSRGLQAVWQSGEQDAGSFKRMFGRNPIMTQSHSGQDIRDVYWRQYVKTGPGWSGNPYKLSRATSFAGSNWSQGMIAHVWGDGSGDALLIDPATGIDANNRLATTRYNDFGNLRWLGLVRGTSPVFAPSSVGRWYCVEAHVALNSPGAADGVFEMRIDGALEARKVGLNWVGSWQAYGINAIAFENYWNVGAPGPRVRYIDNIAISTRPIGCSGALPAAPRNLRVIPGEE